MAYEMAQRLVADGETVAFLGMINCWFPNYPSGRIGRVTAKVQRLRHHIRLAREHGTTLIGFIQQKRSGRREAQLRQQGLDAARREVAQHGFQRTDSSQNEVLLEATTVQFERYRPQPYPGRISLFISDDAAVAGVSKNLDPRFAWAKHAASHEIRVFPGGHEAVLEMPYAVNFAETLKAALEDALR